MTPVNYAVCENCRKRVPARHVAREGKVYILKQCPDCGPTEALVSSDAATWQHKREIWQYDPAAAHACKLTCNSCGRRHDPRIVFVDVTNRCNMNCPICIANIPGMGFEFHPPMDYFDRVFRGLAAMPSRPAVMLFGGEPTVREDLLDIIALARTYDLKVRVVTNGIRLADEDYCQKLCEAKVPILIAFDGRDPAIYARLRKSPDAYEKKLKAIENLKKYSRTKNIIMCCVARKINEQHIGDLIRFCHESRDTFTALHLIPLTETWEEGEFETDVSTNIEDVEQIVDDAIPDEKVEFAPAGLTFHLLNALRFFGSPRLTFGAVHPNCESATMLFSDGERFHALSHYLKRPLADIGADVVTRAKRIERKLERLDPARFLQRWRGRLTIAWAFGGLALRSLRFRAILRGNRVLSLLRIFGGTLLGRRFKDQLRKHTTIRGTLSMIVLPFEEHHSIDGARLELCKAGFAYEDTITGQINTIPVCAWSLYRTEIQRKLAEKFAPEAVPAPFGA